MLLFYVAVQVLLADALVEYTRSTVIDYMDLFTSKTANASCIKVAGCRLYASIFDHSAYEDNIVFKTDTHDVITLADLATKYTIDEGVKRPFYFTGHMIVENRNKGLDDSRPFYIYRVDEDAPNGHWNVYELGLARVLTIDRQGATFMSATGKAHTLSNFEIGSATSLTGSPGGFDLDAKVPELFSVTDPMSANISLFPVLTPLVTVYVYDRPSEARFSFLIDCVEEDPVWRFSPGAAFSAYAAGTSGVLRNFPTPMAKANQTIIFDAESRLPATIHSKLNALLTDGEAIAVSDNQTVVQTAMGMTSTTNVTFHSRRIVITFTRSSTYRDSNFLVFLTTTNAGEESYGFRWVLLCFVMFHLYARLH